MTQNALDIARELVKPAPEQENVSSSIMSRLTAKTKSPAVDSHSAATQHIITIQPLVRHRDWDGCQYKTADGAHGGGENGTHKKEKEITVGTHNDRAYVDKADKITVPTVKPKNTSAVSLRATVGGTDGGRRAAYPCSPNDVRRSYASVLKG
jgi:hypothetical protein